MTPICRNEHRFSEGALMKLIAGLGNTGGKFEKSRHNIGFMVADELAGRWSLLWRSERLAFFCESRQKDKTLLIKPVTYMNLSGQAVAHYADYYHIPPEDIAVIQDDLDLPGGRVRVRRRGAAGGHNGIKSVIESLSSDEFNRFKIGIGHPMNHEEAVLRHVLTGFEREEQPLIEEAVRKTADAVECWLSEGIDAAMNKFNGI
jgi:PTH1 family peptidyl-tRNA hydrolase